MYWAAWRSPIIVKTRLRLIPGKDCLVTPKILDGHNVQITLTVETRNNAGKIIDLTMAQVSTRDGQPLEVAVGGYKLALTPVVARE